MALRITQEIKYWLELLGGSVRGAVSLLVEQSRILRKEVAGKDPITHSHPFKRVINQICNG